MSKLLDHHKRNCKVQLDLQCSWKVSPPGKSYFEVDWIIELQFQ